MKTYSLKEYKDEYGVSALHSVLNTLGYSKDQFFNMKSRNFNGKRDKLIVIDVPSFEETLALVSEVNKQVKNLPDDKKNVRNNFYHHKHQFIKYLYESGKVDTVMESEKYYKFNIGEYSFHQQKEWFLDKIVINGTEVYEPKKYDNVFNVDDLKLARIGMATYHKQRR